MLSMSMRWVVAGVLVVCFVLASGITRANEEAEFHDPMVVRLTTDDFDERVNAAELALVEFYAPWCGHCKTLAPEYQKVALQFNTEGSSILIAKVDATKEEKLATRFGIQGFPTLKLFKRGAKEPRDYSGERKADAMISWLNKSAGPAVSVLKTVDEVDDFAAKLDLNVVGFFETLAGPEYDMFVSAAESLRDKVVFAATENRESAAKHELKSTPGVKMFRKFDEPEVVYQGSLTDAAALILFVKSNSVPLFGELTYQNAADLLARNLPFFLVFVDVTKPEEVNNLIDPLKEVAKKYSSKLTFLFLDNGKFGNHQERLGLDGKVPNVAIDNFLENKHFPYAGEVRAAPIEAWVESFVSGKMAPHLKSQPIPDSNDEPVKVVVGKSFESIVFDNDKDVLVEFYAPWCGHCKKLVPIYEKLAQDVSSVKTLVIAKMDTTTNDPPASIRIEGFPTIIFFPAGKKTSPVTFEGKREVDDFIRFLKQHATHAFSIDDSDVTSSSSESTSTPEAQNTESDTVNTDSEALKKDEL